MCSPFGYGLTDEETRFISMLRRVRPLAEAVASLERQTLTHTESPVSFLAYGWFYGPGTSYDPEAPFDRHSQGTMPIVAPVPGLIRSSIA